MGGIDSIPPSAVAVMQSELGQRSLCCEILLLQGSGKPKKVKHIVFKVENPMQEKSERVSEQGTVYKTPAGGAALWLN